MRTLIGMLILAVAPSWAREYRNPDYLAPGAVPASPDRVSVGSVPRTTATSLEIDLDLALAIGLHHSRTVTILEAQLESDLQTYRSIKANFHPLIAAGSDTDDIREISITQRLNSDGSLRLMHRVPQEGQSRFTATLSQTLNVLSDPTLRQGGLNWVIAQLTYLEGLEAFKLSVIEKFFEVLLNQELLASQEEQIQRARTLVEIAKAKFEIGLSSKLDLLNSEVILGRARTAAIDQRARYQKSVDELRDLLGIETLSPLEVDHELVFHEIQAVGVEGVRRDLEAGRVRWRLARSEEGEARQRSRPRFDLDITYDEDPASDPASEVIAGLKYTFAVGGRPEDFRFLGRKALTRVAHTRYRDLWFQVRREQRDILRILKARAEAVRVAEVNLKNAQESYEFSKLAFERGMINNIDLRNTQDNLTQARNALISILIDYMTSTYRYVRVFGGTL